MNCNAGGKLEKKEKREIQTKSNSKVISIIKWSKNVFSEINLALSNGTKFIISSDIQKYLPFFHQLRNHEKELAGKEEN